MRHKKEREERYAVNLTPTEAADYGQVCHFIKHIRVTSRRNHEWERFLTAVEINAGTKYAKNRQAPISVYVC